LVLSYIYRDLCLQHLSSSLQSGENGENTSQPLEHKEAFFDQDFLANVQKILDTSIQEPVMIQTKITELLQENPEDEIPYYLKNFFDKRTTEDIDAEYVLKMLKAFPTFKQEVEKAVNEFTETFSFQQMDVLDQSIFLLWYTEWKEIETPKEILINEVVELGKRYSDDGSPKLLNGIMHKILNAIK